MVGVAPLVPRWPLARGQGVDLARDVLRDEPMSKSNPFTTVPVGYAMCLLACLVPACAFDAATCEPIPYHLDLGPREEYEASCPDFAEPPACPGFTDGSDPARGSRSYSPDDAACEIQQRNVCGGAEHARVYTRDGAGAVELRILYRRISDGCTIRYVLREKS